MGIVESDKRLMVLLNEAIDLCSRQDHRWLLMVVRDETQDEVDRYSRPLRLLAGGKQSAANLRHSTTCKP